MVMFAHLNIGNKRWPSIFFQQPLSEKAKIIIFCAPDLFTLIKEFIFNTNLDGQNDLYLLKNIAGCHVSLVL